MKNVAFHSNQLGIRGTEVALYDYALYNEIILGNKSFILSDKTKDLQALKKFQDKFNVFLYDSFEDTFKFTKDRDITHVYFIKGGDNDSKVIPNTKNAIHAVFQEKDFHGDSYAYVSKWLAEKMNSPEKYVPHIVTLPPPLKNYRNKLGLSDEQLIVGRYGGLNEFDLPFAKQAVINAAKSRPDIVFLFMNTAAFCNQANVIFIEGTYNLQNKSDYINTCDYMLHARHRGESFGLAISEFLFHDKPIISWKNGLDRNHIEILGDKGIWYDDEYQLNNLLLNLNKNDKHRGYYKSIVDQFCPEVVMKRFDRIFLQ